MALKPLSRSLPSRSSNVSNEEKKAPRRYTISLSFAGLLTSGIIMIIAVGWIFAFGVIVGRGYNPEKKMPELASLLPTPEGKTAEQEEETPILKPEELTFMSDLKQRGMQNATNSAVASAVVPTPVKPAPAPKKAEAPKPSPAAPTDKTQYDYVLQVVAYKNKEQASTLRERLEGEGVRTRLRVEKDNRGNPKWFRVQVLFRGTEAGLEPVKDLLHRVGLRDAQQVSKTPVKRSR